MDFSVIMGYKKFLHKNFAEYYSGPYRFATRQEYVQGKIRHFRFVFEAAWDYELIGGKVKKEYIMCFMIMISGHIIKQ